MQRTLLDSGQVPALPQWEPDEMRWQPDSPLYDYIRSLPASIDGDRVLRILAGLDSTQRLGLPLIVNTVSRIRQERPQLEKRAAALRRLRQRYSQLWKGARLHEDPLLRPSTREALRQDLEAVLVAINMLGPRAPKDRPLPRMGISVRPGKDLSRQRFWTEPMAALVDYLAGALGGNNAAYKATARLLNLAYDFPDKWRLVERRVHHLRRKRIAKN